MTDPSTDHANGGDELLHLTHRWCDGLATADERARLDALLQASPAARQTYVAYLQLHAALLWRHRGVSAAPTDLSAVADASEVPSILSFLGRALHSMSRSTFSPRIIALAVAGGLLTYFAVLTLSVVLTRPTGSDRGQTQASADESKAAARISMTADCRWHGSRPAPGIGEPLPAGIARLTQGAVALDFGHGARVSIEAPAEFLVRGPDGIELITGRLLAQLPPEATGFLVATKAAEIVDLGTEFGVSVNARGETEVHVLRGEVEIFPVVGDAGSATMLEHRLSGGQSLRVAEGGAVGQVVYDDEPFAHVRDLIATASRREVQVDAIRNGPAPIWLGNLFDDPAGTPLAKAVESDTYLATPEVGDLGIERVIHGGDRPKSVGDWVAGVYFADGLIQIAPRLTFDFSNLGWHGKLHGSIANDAYGQFNAFPNGGLSTRGIGQVIPDAKVEEGIGMHADSLITFDLEKIRAAGEIKGRRLEFVCDRAGMNDDLVSARSTASFHMVVLVSDGAGLRTTIVDGRPMEVHERAGVWACVSPPGEPLRADGRFFPLRVPLPPEAAYLTLAVTMFDQENSMDHGVWSGARLEVAKSIEP